MSAPTPPRPCGRPPVPVEVRRRYCWPGKICTADVSRLAYLAARAGVSPAEYVRLVVLG